MSDSPSHHVRMILVNNSHATSCGVVAFAFGSALAPGPLARRPMARRQRRSLSLRETCVEHVPRAGSKGGAAVCFQPCLVHQLMRSIAANAVHSELGALFYSFTRLMQWSRYRARVLDNLSIAVARRLRVECCSSVPATATSPESTLVFDLLTRTETARPDVAKATKEAWTFFNGQTCSPIYQHHCAGLACCGSLQVSRQKA